MANSIKPCPACKEADICAAHDWLKIVRHPWTAGEIQQFFSFVSMARALAQEGAAGLDLTVECERFKSRS